MTNPMPYRVFKDIIKANVEIRLALKARFKELGLSYEKVAEEGHKHGQKLSKSTISKYIKYGCVRETPTQESIIWMCEQYNIDINISATKKPDTHEHE